MTIFIDTSALYAVLCADDPNHKAARITWLDLLSQPEDLICTNYILVESFALIQNRLGIQAVRAFQEDVIPLLGVEWLGAVQHQAAISAVLIAGRKQLSLVDCASFETMRRLGITTAFAFDPHFKEQGFTCIP
ncbi:MAG: type II toxin-antitoxin system VapC family toxin [Anaerolineales bacterium]|nr:type II toxin-antitoxin system VapC family toxin [Anaerolineales bacterium]